MSVERQYRQVGDTLTPIAGQLLRPDNTVVDLTGLTVSFVMYNTQGNVKVEETEDGVTVDDAEQGKVSYSPSAADVDTAGTYYAYFLAAAGSRLDSFPVQTGYFIISIQERA